MKKEEKKQLKYYELKDQYAKEFSELMIQRLGLTVDYSGLLEYEDIIVGGSQLKFTYNSFNYVPYENAQLAETNPDTIKVFDPYNDLGLATYCVMQYLCYIEEIDVNKCVSIIAVNNTKMNEPGEIELTFNENMNNQKIVGHTYNRDCLKFLDLIYVLDGADDAEYTALKNLDLVNYDKFEL